MDRSQLASGAQVLPGIVRLTFTIHLVVALIIGLALLLAPIEFGTLLGFPSVPEVQAPLRGFGAALLGLGGLTSFYGVRARSWAQVEYIVRGEIAYLALQTLGWLVSGLTDTVPALAVWLDVVLSAALLALFAASFSARPK